MSTYLHDLWAMGFATAMAIALFAALFVIPFVVIWFVARGIGDTWRFLANHTSGALRGSASRHATRSV